jgi:hypothetical protein
MFIFVWAFVRQLHPFDRFDSCEMIDWFNLLANSFWIFGLALALAALSHASWQASLTRQTFRSRLAQPLAQTALNTAGVFFCAGLAATSQPWWEIGLWVILSISFGVQIVLTLLSWKTAE